MLPGAIVVPLKQHPAQLHRWRLRERQQGAPSVSLPPALRRKYPAAPLSWAWQFMFPSATVCTDPHGAGLVRHHLRLQRQYSGRPRQRPRVQQSAKPAECHTFHHCFAIHLPENGYDIRTVQELLSHTDVRTTMIYTHVLNRGGLSVRSPLDVSREVDHSHQEVD